MGTPLLIEIGLEELPALPLLREAARIPALWSALLAENGLAVASRFYYTPRRLVLWHDDFPARQADSVAEFFGPPVAIAFKEGEATPAAKSFAAKCGVELSEIGEIDKEGKTVLYFKKEVPGETSSTLVGALIEKLLGMLAFGKTMRWGSLQESFIRPVRWLTVLYGSEVLPASLFGVVSGRCTYGHRQYGFEAISLAQAGDFFAALDQGGVVLDPDVRREKILAAFAAIERELGVMIERDEELLDEVVAITEWPTPVVGSFDELFLTVPPEAIITSMKTNQRYFPIFSDGKLSNRFVVVSNALTDDFSLIVQGNERVLRARLSDAHFFYANDLKSGLRPESLATVVFMDGIGSLYDKTLREVQGALMLDRLTGSGADTVALQEAVMLSKADLMSEMVYEFTDLQGIMGSYYAHAAGFDASIVTAIREQYLPSGEESALPSTRLSALVAMAHKLDNLMALFSLGKIPTGSKDPFALRRAALGIIKTVDDQHIPFPLTQVIDELAGHYPAGLDRAKLVEFFLERLVQYFDVNPSVVKAVIESGERDLSRLLAKIRALAFYVASDDFRDNFATFKRVVNISKEADLSADLPVDERLFETEQEKILWSLFADAAYKNDNDDKAKLGTLFALKGALESFFDHVMVNAEDEAIRTNRKNMVARIAKEFKKIADIKEITL